MAALSSLNRFTDVESPTITSPGPAPISRAILSAMRCDKVIQPAVFQLRIRPSPHSLSATAAILAAVAAGKYAERVAVEVDHPLRIDTIHREQRPARCERIEAVASDALFPGDHESDRNTARTGEAHALISLRGSAISS